MEREPLRTGGELEEIIRRYQSMVYGLALARTGSPADADDVFQETFLAYYRAGKVFREEEHRKAWLIRVTVNCAKSFHESARMRKMQPLQENLVWEDPETHSLHDELQRLPPRYRDVIHLFYYEGFSTDEIADILHRKNSTVRTQLTRARAMLRAFMEEDENV